MLISAWLLLFLRHKKADTLYTFVNILIFVQNVKTNSGFYFGNCFK